MATNDIIVTKTYRDGAAYFERQVDNLKTAIETVSRITNKNLNQLRRDLFLSSYNYTNDGNAQLSNSLQQQINSLASGGIPITGTTSNTFTVRSASNSLTISASSLSTPITTTYPNESGEVVLNSATQTLTNKTLTSPTMNSPKIRDAGLLYDYTINPDVLSNDVNLNLPSLTSGDEFVFVSHAQFLANKVLIDCQINDTSSDHQYIIGVSELTADRTITLPLLTSNDTFVFEAHTQTLTNKTLTSPILTSPVLTSPQINDTSSDHQYIIGVSELTADRTITLPLLTSNDTFVFRTHTQTLTNKTLTSPTINSGAYSGTFTGNHTLSGVVTFGDEILLPDVDPPTANYANRNGIVKAFVKVTLAGNGAGGVIIATSGYNIDSANMTGTTSFDINWDTNFSNTNYVVDVVNGPISGTATLTPNDIHVSAQSAGSITVASMSGASIAETNSGRTYVYYIKAIGDQ